MLSNVQVDNFSSNSLELKSVENLETTNDSSQIHTDIDSNINSGVSQESEDTESFDSSETDISRNNETDSIFSEHERTNNNTSLNMLKTERVY